MTSPASQHSTTEISVSPSVRLHTNHTYFATSPASMRSTRSTTFVASSASSSQAASLFQLHGPDRGPYPIPTPSLVVPSFDQREGPAAYSEDNTRRSGRPSSVEQEPSRLFACPYTQYDPARYSAANLKELNYRSCGHCYLTDISRLKQHLYRVHERPHHYCPTCFQVFKNQERCAKHIVSRSCTEAQQCPFEEKMSPEQLAMIKKKNRGTNPYTCWYDIYQTLFPDAPAPASPYATFTTGTTPTPASLDHFMQFVQERAPARLRQRLSSNLIWDEGTLMSLELSVAGILQDLRHEFDLSVQTERAFRPARASFGQPQDDDELRGRSQRKRKATEMSLNRPHGFQFPVDAQGMTSVGDVSASASYSSTPALADDEGEHLTRRPIASPSRPFVMDMEHPDIIPDVPPEQMMRVVSNEHRWQSNLRTPDEQHRAPYFVADHRASASPHPVFPPETEDWQMVMMAGANLTMGMPQPGYNATAPRQWNNEGANPMW